MRKIRTTKGITLLEIAEKIGKTEATIQRYESGNIKNLKSDDIEGIAGALKTDPAYLMGWVSDNKSITNDYNYYPHSISAGLPFIADGTTELKTVTIPNELMGRYAGHNDIVISKINGDSMDKLMKDGSFIAIKPITLPELKNGDIVVFSNEHEYSVKYFYKHDDKLIFKPYSHNNCHHEQHYNEHDNIQIHGKVVTYIVNLD